MLKVFVIVKEETPQDQQYWQEIFTDVWEGPVEISVKAGYLKTQDADLIIIDLSKWDNNAIETLQKFSSNITGKHCLIVSNKRDIDIALEAVKLGAIGFLVKPFKRADLIASLDRLHTVKFINNNQQETKKKSRIIPLISYKGGTGVSTITVNLGYALAKIYKKKVLIIDACLFANHISFLLNVVPKCSLADILKEGKNIDEQYITTGTATHTQNLGVISGLTKTKSICIDENSIENLKYMIEIASSTYDYILIDTSARVLDEVTIFFLQYASYILLITSFDLLALKDSTFYIAALTELGINNSMIKPIINRYDLPTGNLESDLFKKHIDIPIFHNLFNAWETCVKSVNDCIPIIENSPNSKLAISFKSLAEKIISLDLDTPIQSSEQKPKGLLGWIKDIKITTT